MLKPLGAILIIASAGACGALKSLSLKKRSEALLRLKNSLFLLRNEISYGKNDIKSALRKIGITEKFPLFTIASEVLNTSTSDAFSVALEKCGNYYSDTDKDIIYDFSANLGMLDTEAQIKSIENTVKLISHQYTSAYSDYSKYGKMYRSMGILIGLLFIVILL